MVLKIRYLVPNFSLAQRRVRVLVMRDHASMSEIRGKRTDYFVLGSIPNGADANSLCFQRTIHYNPKSDCHEPPLVGVLGTFPLIHELLKTAYSRLPKSADTPHYLARKEPCRTEGLVPERREIKWAMLGRLLYYLV